MATRNASIVEPVPKRRATRSSLATDANLATEVKAAIVVAARKTWRFVEPVVNLSQKLRHLLPSLFAVSRTMIGRTVMQCRTGFSFLRVAERAFCSEPHGHSRVRWTSCL